MYTSLPSLATMAPSQDRTATYIVLYMSGALLLLSALFLSSPLLIAVFVLSGAGQLCAGRCTHDSIARGVTYFDAGGSRWASKLGPMFVTGAGIGRWLLANQLLANPVTHRLSYLATTATVVAILAALTNLYAGSAGAVRNKILAIFMWSATLILGAAMLFRHFRRNITYAHERHEVRLWYSSLTQFFQTLLLFPGTSYLPYWVLEALSIVLWVLLWVCSGHKHFH
eukprot:m.8172 g.8172  ORF g.8172 m.8172 type:complete len:226 (-) comp3159_c0_seq1:101-778(-)